MEIGKFWDSLARKATIEWGAYQYRVNLRKTGEYLVDCQMNLETGRRVEAIASYSKSMEAADRAQASLELVHQAGGAKAVARIGKDLSERIDVIFRTNA